MIGLSIDEVAVLVAEAIRITDDLDRAELLDKPENAPLARGVLTCGEACRLIPALVMLGLQVYPNLLEAGVFEQAIRFASTQMASGVPN